MNNKEFQLIKKIVDKYKRYYSIDFTNERTCCYVHQKKICINIDDFIAADYDCAFDILHEVGHLKTTKDGMLRWEEEYYATVWAIKEMKKFDFSPSKQRKNEYQQYIYDCSKGRKSAPSKDRMKLVWA